MKAIVIGRHNGEIPGFDIAEKRNLTFPSTSEECAPLFAGLLSDAFAARAALIFQALPGQMVSAICTNIGRGGPITHVPVGIVVSKPGERPAGKEYTLTTSCFLVIIRMMCVAQKLSALQSTSTLTSALMVLP